MVINASWYSRNKDLRKDLEVESVKRLATIYKRKLKDQSNCLTNNLYSTFIPRRLSKKHHIDLINNVIQ